MVLAKLDWSACSQSGNAALVLGPTVLFSEALHSPLREV